MPELPAGKKNPFFVLSNLGNPGDLFFRVNDWNYGVTVLHGCYARISIQSPDDFISDSTAPNDTELLYPFASLRLFVDIYDCNNITSPRSRNQYGNTYVAFYIIMNIQKQ
jgi:hypothetical protein